MISKILFTKDPSIKNINQLDFEMPVGYKLYTPETIEVSPYWISTIDLQVSVFTDTPATFIFTPAIQSIDFRLIDPFQLIAPQVATPLKLNVVNPIPDGEEAWELEAGSLVATLLVVETYTVNLFEVSNKVFKQYE